MAYAKQQKKNVNKNESYRTVSQIQNKKNFRIHNCNSNSNSNSNSIPIDIDCNKRCFISSVIIFLKMTTAITTAIIVVNCNKNTNNYSNIYVQFVKKIFEQKKKILNVFFIQEFQQ